MCDMIESPDPVHHLVHEWEHGAMSRREFLQRGTILLGSLTAAQTLLTSCSPAIVATATAAPAATTPATAIPVPTVAPTVAATPISAPRPTTAPTTAATTSNDKIPGFVDPSAVNTTEVTYKNGDITLMGHLAKPKTMSGPLPAVIVIHENRGLTDHIKDVTRRIANLGYVALGVDFLSRLGGTNKFNPPEDPTRAINTLTQDNVNSDIVASVAYLKSLTDVKPKIGIVGFCWGGANSMQGALSSKDINAAIIFYGRNPANLDDVAKLNAAVIGNYGELDTGISGGVPALEAAMKKHNKPFEYKIYKGANHAFFNDTGPRFDEVAAKDAWARLTDFYKKNLA